MKNRFIQVEITKRAQKALDNRDEILDIQIELLFSCMIRKRILFRLPSDIVTYPMSCDESKLNIQFRPVMTKVCLVSDVDDVPDLEDLPIHNAKAFMPRWLKIDYQIKEDLWSGEFGWL